MFLSVGKGMGLHLYIAQVGLEKNTTVGSLCIHVMNRIMMLYHLLCMRLVSCEMHNVCLIG